MDFSNKDESKYWYQQAQAEPDPALRKLALAAHRRFHRLAVRESKLGLRMSKPGYGVRSLLGFLVFLTLCVLAAILVLRSVFPGEAVAIAFAAVFAVIVLASAVALRVTGHVSEDTMVRLIQGCVQPVVLGKPTPGELDEVHSEGQETKSPPKQLPPAG